MNFRLSSVLQLLLMTGLAILAAWALQRKPHSDGAKNPSPMLVQSERDFILGMVPHHQEAVDSSTELLKVATDSDIRRLAEGIISSQDGEITQMKSWYSQWFSEQLVDEGRYQPMMRSLVGLAPKDAEARFVADMVGHHEHAVLMAKELQNFTQRPELLSLSGNIIRDQEAEIAQLKVWLKEKYGQAPPMVDHSMHKM